MADLNLNKAYKLLALDMDGTILNSAKKITPKTAKAISELNKRGVYVVLSTGRGLAEIADYKEDIKSIHYGILTHPLDEESMIQLIDGAIVEGAMIQLLTENDSLTREEDILNMKNFGMGIYQDMYFRNCVRCDDFKKFVLDNPQKVLKLNIYHRSTESRERNFKRFENLDVTFSYAEETALETTPKNISKGNGLKELCDFLKIDISETVAVGDAQNDLEIFQTAGLAVAMGNAESEIKNLADFVTDDNDNDGVAKVIEKIWQ